MVEWTLFTLSAACFINANLGETLSSRTRTLFSSNFPVLWFKPVRLVHHWDLDQSYLIGTKTQHLFHTVIYWLIVVTNGKSIRSLHKYWFHSFKNSCPWTFQAFKVFRRWTQKNFFSPTVPIISSQEQMSILPVLPKKPQPVPFRMHIKTAQRKPAKLKKTLRGEFSKSDCCLSNQQLGSKEETFWRPKCAQSS